MPAARPDADSAPRPPDRAGHRLAGVAWPLGLAISVALCALIPLLGNPNFYFYADTPEGAFGQWYELGQHVRAGNLPLMNPAVWMAGNYVAEGQWGLFNPFVLAVALAVSAAPDAVAISSAVKIVTLVIGALGAYTLAREVGASRAWAFVAGVGAPFAGFTLFMDASSWVTNQFVWAFWLWSAAAILAHARRGVGFWAPAVATYLLVTVGYLQGTVMLILFYVVSLGEAGVRRQWDRFGRIFLTGVAAGLVAFAVYLPGLLTSSVTTRTSSVKNDGFMVLTMTGLATAGTPSSAGPLSGWWGEFSDIPLLYIAWFLPLLALTVPSDWRGRTGASTVAIFTAVATLWAMGPSEMGPLRFPVRTMPWVATGVLVLGAVAWTARSQRRARSIQGLVAAWTLAGIGMWLTYATTPDQGRRIGLFGLVTLGGLAVGWWLLGAPARRARVLAAPLALAVVSVIVLGMQTRVYAPQLQSRADYPAATLAYQQAMPDAHGDGIVVGNPLELGDALFDSTIFGNSWYLEDQVSVQNVYTPVGFATYSQDLCLLYDGRTCPELATRLFETDPTTGLPLADLLSLDTVQVLATDGVTPAQLRALPTPAGWSVSSATDASLTWTREQPTAPAGAVTWSSPGVTVVEEDHGDLDVDLSVTAPQGGTVVLSRLAWPGYGVRGASLGAPLRGYLVTLEVPASPDPQSVTLSWRPPGWSAVLAAFAGFALLTVGASLWPLLPRHKMGPRRAAPVS